jgi:hypothetical protein
MAITKTTNPVTQSTMQVSPGEAFKVICSNGIAARNSVILFAYSVTAFLFNVNKFRAATDKDYRSAKDAVEYVTKELASQTSVKSGMLDRYVRVGSDLYGKLSADRFADLHKKLLSATDAGKIPDILAGYLKDKANVDTLSDLMRTLGYSTGHDKKAAAPADPEARVQNVGASMTALVKQLTDKAHKPNSTAQRLVAQQVASALDPVTLARQAIQRITDPEDLLDLITWANTLADKLADADEKPAKKAKASPAKKAVKAKAKAVPVTHSASA